MINFINSKLSYYRVPGISKLFAHDMRFFQSPAVFRVANDPPTRIRTLNLDVSIVEAGTTPKPNHLTNFLFLNYR